MICLEHRFLGTGDGGVWTQTAFAYPFWERYLTVFDGVRVVARVRAVPAAADDWQRADGAGVSFIQVPHYVGPIQYLGCALAVRRVVRGALREEDAVVLRLGSNIASVLAPALWSTGRPYGVEVVGDPYDAFSPGAVNHPLRPLFRWWFSHRLRRECSHACAAAYVTRHALQRRYPPAPGAFTAHYSSVELPEEAFVRAPRSWRDGSPPRLVFVGTLEQLYKAPDLLLEAVSRCRARGVAVQLTVVGDGKYRATLEAMARNLSIQGSVRFLGQLPVGAAVREQLDAADLFVLPSRQEGLPRAMIEAMARGLPCIGSTVGGIPEVLPPQDMTPPGDAEALAAKIVEVLSSPERMAVMSQRNLQKAREYHDDVLCERRSAFQQYVKDTTRRWLSGRSKRV